MRELFRKLATFFRRDSFDRELEEEMQAHLALEAEENERNGMPAREARLAARRQFGNTALLGESSREAWRWRLLDELARDLKHALRTLRRSPSFAAVAIATIALGVGANIAVSTVIYKVVLRPVDYREPDRLMDVDLILTEQRRGTIPMSWSYPKFQELLQWNRSFEALAAFQPAMLTFPAPDPERLTAEIVSAQYFRMVGVNAHLGRTFADEEDTPAGARISIVISDGLWRRRFGADPGILGKSLRMQGITWPIVGVMPPGFRGETGRTDAWAPMAAYLTLNPRPGRNGHNLEVIGRLRPGVSPRQANDDVRMVVARMEREHPTNFGAGDKWSGGARPLLEARVDPVVRRSLWILQAATACVLLIACVNLANLLLSRGAARRREIAIRLALGTTRGGLLRQSLVEPALLALGGGVAGLLLAAWGLRLIALILPGADANFGFSYVRFIDPSSLRVEAPMLAFGILLAAATGIIFGLLPAWQAARTDVNSGLKSGAGGSGPLHLRLRNTLVVAQMALALVLLAAAGLMIRSFAGLLGTNFGVETRGIITLSVQPHARDKAGRLAFYRELERRASALPGAEAAAFTNGLPVYGPDLGTTLHVEGRADAIDTGDFIVSPSYFAVYRIPLLAGRTFGESEGADAARVVVLSDLAARRFFPRQDPIGKQIDYPQSGGVKAEVVGVVGNVKYGPPEAKDRPVVYSSSLQTPPLGYLTVRTAGDPQTLVPALRGIIRALEPEAPVYDIRTVGQQIALATWRTRLAAVLLGMMAALSLALAAVGIYGVFSYAVAARTRDIGVRIALGATREKVMGAVLGQAAALSAVALAIGAPAAFVLARSLGPLLYGVGPGDPWAYGAGAGVLVAAALLACFLPARRATRIDPVEALRSE